MPQERADITMVGPAFPYRGGIAQYTTMLFKAAETRFQVRLINFTRQYPGLLFPGKTQLDDSDLSFSVPNERIIDPLNPISWVRAFFKIKSLGSKAVVFQWWQPFFGPCYGTIAWLLRLFTRQKLVFVCHNVVPHETHLVDRLLTWYAFASVHTLIVHTKPDAHQAKLIRSGATIVRQPHPVYHQFRVNEPSQAEAREQLAVRGNLLLFFGLVRAYKGLRYLVQSLPEVLRELDVTLVVAGEFYEPRQEYDRMVSDLGLGKNVTIVDRYIPNEEVELYFTACDAVVCPYVSGTQSGVIQIAYSFHKPVIGTRVGGLPEVVVEGKTGFLADPQDPHDLARAILKCFRSPDRETIRANVAAAAEGATWDALVEAIVDA